MSIGVRKEGLGVNTWGNFKSSKASMKTWDIVMHNAQISPGGETTCTAIAWGSVKTDHFHPAMGTKEAAKERFP